MMGRREWSKPTGTRCLLSMGAIFALAAPASADFIEYEQNFAGWQAAAGSYTTIASAFDSDSSSNDDPVADVLELTS